MLYLNGQVVSPTFARFGPVSRQKALSRELNLAPRNGSPSSGSGRGGGSPGPERFVPEVPDQATVPVCTDSTAVYTR
jgi:hypothetical protein